MKNLIYILVDALSYDNVGKREYRQSPTAFLDELKEQSLSYENMYTQAPYTEAAFVSTVCGENVLDHGGYLLGLQNCDTCYANELKKKGYHTLSTFSPYIMSKSYIRGVDEYYYSRAFSLSPLKLYRLDYYKEKYAENIITDQEYEICEILLEDTFETWLDQMEGLLHKDERTVLIQDLINESDKIADVLELVKAQQEIFFENKRRYVKHLFEKGTEHELFQISNVTIKQKVKPETRAYIEEKYGDFLKDVQRKQNALMKKNQNTDYTYLLDLLLHDENRHHGMMQTYRRYKERFASDEIEESVNAAVEEKVTISARRQLDKFSERILELDGKSENYFAFIHLEDFHLPSMTYSYDIDDLECIDREFDKLREFVEKVPDNYQGNLLADMSAFYVDMVLKEFFEKLTQQTKNEFVFVVTADHGYPCNYNPPRPIIFNAFYQENYHIPCVIYNSAMKEKEVKRGLYSSLDIMQVLLNKVEENKKTVPERDHVLIEYPGPGCPDISKKEIYYAIFDGKYKLGIKAKLADDVTAEKVVLATDVEKDPYEKKNLIRQTKKNARMKELIHIVNVRHMEVRDKFSGDKFYMEMLKR